MLLAVSYNSKTDTSKSKLQADLKFRQNLYAVFEPVYKELYNWYMWHFTWLWDCSVKTMSSWLHPTANTVLAVKTNPAAFGAKGKAPLGRTHGLVGAETWLLRLCSRTIAQIQFWPFPMLGQVAGFYCHCVQKCCSSGYYIWKQRTEGQSWVTNISILCKMCNLQVYI